MCFEKDLYFAPVSFAVFVRFRHFENKAAEVWTPEGKTHSHSPSWQLIAKRKFVIFGRCKIPNEFQLISWKTHGSSLFFTRALDFENADRKIYKYIWQTEIFRFATDGRMSAVFLAVIFVCAKPIFGANEDIKSLVMEGHFKIKCEEMVSFTYKVWS